MSTGTRLAPTVTADTKFFWDGLAEHRLLVQRCTSCDSLRHPPRPMCPRCNSLEWDTVDASGSGSVHSFVLPQHPQFPFLEYPYVVALVDLDEGVRILTNLVDVDDPRIGMAVTVRYVEFDGGLVLHQFGPA
jgi:uncharacterized OB-fold protein